MDGSRFDNITRTLATGQPRRQALQVFAGGALAGLLAHFGVEDAAGACIKPGRRCDGAPRKRCCGHARCRSGPGFKAGRCVCQRETRACGDKCVRLKRDPKHCGGCNKKCRETERCIDGTCQTGLGCRVGDHLCRDSTLPNCPHTTNPNCYCLTDVAGNPRCSDLTQPYVCSSTCTKNSDCGIGMACFPANFDICGCEGNACAAAWCDGEL